MVPIKIPTAVNFEQPYKLTLRLLAIPAAIIVSFGATGTPAALAQSTSSPLDLIRQAACNNNADVLKNGLSLVQAGVVSNQDAMAAAETALKTCALPAISISGGYYANTLNFYLTVKQAYVKAGGTFVNRFPFVLALGEYAPSRNSSFGRLNLAYQRYAWVSLETNYERYLLISNIPYGYNQNFDRANYIRRATPTINQRDCLGYLPLWYAINRDDFALAADMIAAGADGALEVPYTTNGIGILGEFIQPYVGKQVRYLNADVACDALATESKVFNVYRDRKMTIPLWIFAWQRLNGFETEFRLDVISKMLAKATSAPSTLFADLIDLDRFALDLQRPKDLAIFEKVIALGANINAKSSKGQTLLGYVLKNTRASPELVKQLTAHGAQM